jgi:hypothetical protein
MEGGEMDISIDGKDQSQEDRWRMKEVANAGEKKCYVR